MLELCAHSAAEKGVREERYSRKEREIRQIEEGKGDSVGACTTSESSQGTWLSLVFFDGSCWLFFAFLCFWFSFYLWFAEG